MGKIAHVDSDSTIFKNIPTVIVFSTKGRTTLYEKKIVLSSSNAM